MTIRGILFDMDGVLYHGTQRLAGVLEFFEWLPVPHCFVTNNSSRTPQQVANKLAAMQIAALPEQIITSSIVTAHYLTQHAPPQACIFAIGEEGLFSALEDANFRLTTSQPDYVVVGLDRAFDATKLQTAAQAIQNGATFIATNLDSVLITENGTLPGTGTLVQQVANAAQKTPLVMGKPERPMFDLAATYLKLPLHELLMIGDNIETDIRGALRYNLYAAFMLSGVSSPHDLAQSGLIPHFVSPYLLDLLPQLADNLSK